MKGLKEIDLGSVADSLVWKSLFWLQSLYEISKISDCTDLLEQSTHENYYFFYSKIFERTWGFKRITVTCCKNYKEIDCKVFEMQISQLTSAVKT